MQGRIKEVKVLNALAQLRKLDNTRTDELENASGRTLAAVETLE